MTLATTTDPYEALRPIMNRYGASCSARDFYWAVNQAYHTVEAQQYDELHEAMFLGLEPVWERLLARAATHPNAKLRVLDVGAGTGLVGGFLKVHLVDRVASLTMLDPCAAMLEQCRRRAELFSFPGEVRHGDIHALGDEERFEVITINSVLHHIVDLPGFFRCVRKLLTPRGWLLTAHDPRAEGTKDPELQARRRKARRARRHLGRSVWSRLTLLLRSAARRPAISPLAADTSDRLLAQGTIRQPMPMDSIYSVTDFHVPGQPGNVGKGIALEELKEWLPGVTLIEECTYQFHGIPWTNLTREEQQAEREWWATRDRHGELLASAWCREGDT
jgi:ubiquinone/menaquinone biosynthesis C-methylase UbiE